MSVRPCRHPGCRDLDGNRRLTAGGVCERCLPRVDRLLEDLGVDFAMLVSLPRPEFGAGFRVDGSVVGFGHPAAWASETKGEIADNLAGWHENLCDELGDRFPFGPRREGVKVRAALGYIRPRLDRLAGMEWCEDALEEWLCLDRLVRGTLGLRPPPEWLPCPCWGCDSVGLFLDRSRAVVVIRCLECGWSLEEQHFGLYERALRDARSAEGLSPVAGSAATGERL